MDLKSYLQNRDRRQFATQVGTSYGYLRLIISRVRRPSPELAARISAATEGEVAIEELLFPGGLPLDSRMAAPGRQVVTQGHRV
jgi:hypothetical protein